MGIAMDHPQKNDKGQTVQIKSPSEPTAPDTWSSADQVATVVPGGQMPAELNGLAFDSWLTHPGTPDAWNAVPGLGEFDEPPFVPAPSKKISAGVVVEEPDGRVWLVHPTNQFGGYISTFPKGAVEHGLNLRTSAIKGAQEEAGLRVELTGWLVDTIRTTSKARYYLARRVSGNPADMGWKSQAVHLVPRGDFPRFLDNPMDLPILEKLLSYRKPSSVKDIITHEFGLTSGHRILAAISNYRHRYHSWPTRILMDHGMADAIKDKVLTPLGWRMLNDKVQVISADVSTVYAEGLEGRVEYGEHTHLSDKGSERPDIWLWGINVTADSVG